MTGWRGQFLRHFPLQRPPDFITQDDRVERTLSASFPPSKSPDFKTQHDRVERIV
jgi:hypothetical protein